MRKIVLVFGLVIILSITGFYLYLRPKYVVPILMYHHIDGKGRACSLSLSPESFRRQMHFLSRCHYNVISLKRLTQAIRSKETLPRNSVVITFDDGYADNYYSAFPVLEEYGLAATIFVMVDYIGKDGYLTFEQIKEMLSSEIIDIGSHSLSGEYLPGKTGAQLAREIGLSKELLEDNLSEKIELFCYPIGGFNAQIQEIVQRCGYLAACSTNRARAQTYSNGDLFALKRIKVRDSFPNLVVFWAKVSGYYNTFRRVRNPY